MDRLPRAFRERPVARAPLGEALGANLCPNGVIRFAHKAQNAGMIARDDVLPPKGRPLLLGAGLTRSLGARLTRKYGDIMVLLHPKALVHAIDAAIEDHHWMIQVLTPENIALFHERAQELDPKGWAPDGSFATYLEDGILGLADVPQEWVEDDERQEGRRAAWLAYTVCEQYRTSDDFYRRVRRPRS